MKAIVINEFERDFQSKLNTKLRELAHNEIVDIKFSSTFDKSEEKVILHAIILHK